MTFDDLLYSLIFNDTIYCLHLIILFYWLVVDNPLFLVDIQWHPSLVVFWWDTFMISIRSYSLLVGIWWQPFLVDILQHFLLVSIRWHHFHGWHSMTAILVGISPYPFLAGIHWYHLLVGIWCHPVLMSIQWRPFIICSLRILMPNLNTDFQCLFRYCSRFFLCFEKLSNLNVF